MFKYKKPIIAKITLRKKWVQAIEKIDSIEKRSRLLMIIFDGFVRGERYTSCNDPVFAPVLRMIYADLDAVIVAFRKFATKHKLHSPQLGLSSSTAG